MQQTHSDASDIRSGSPDHGGSDRPSVGLLALRIVALGLLAFGGWIVWTATRLAYYTTYGPGPGYFPFWIGLLIALCALAVLVGSFFSGRRAYEGFIPPRRAGWEMAATLIAVIAFALLIERIGFVFTIFGMVFSLMLINRVRIWPTALIVSLIASLGVGYAFVHWFGLVLPPAPGGLFQFIRL